MNSNINHNNNNNNITSSTNNNNNINNNGDELNTSGESMKMSKVVGKFPLDLNGITSVNSIFTSTYIKPSQNGFINNTKTPGIINYNNWNKKKESDEVLDQ
jgi:hypothetical protein